MTGGYNSPGPWLAGDSPRLAPGPRLPAATLADPPFQGRSSGPAAPRHLECIEDAIFSCREGVANLPFSIGLMAETQGGRCHRSRAGKECNVILQQNVSGVAFPI